MAAFSGFPGEEDDDASIQLAIAMSLEDEPDELAQKCALALADSAAAKGVNLAKKVLKKLAEDPDEKYRRLREGNEKTATLWAPSPCQAVLEAVGFERRLEGGEVGEGGAAVGAEGGAEVEGCYRWHLPKGAEYDERARRAVDLMSADAATAGAGAAGGRVSVGGHGAASRPPIASRPWECGICYREVRKHNWAPRGMMMMRARAPWEGMQCDTCYSDRHRWYVICGECFNDSRHVQTEHAACSFSAIGYGVAESNEGQDTSGMNGRAPPPPPPSSNRRGAFG